MAISPPEKIRSPAPTAATPRPRPGPWRTLLALLAPRHFSESLAQADHPVSLSRNPGVSESSPDKQREQLNATRELTLTRLELLRGVLVKSFALMASAVIVGVAFRQLYGGPMLSRGVFAVGSLFLFASATLGRLGWAGQSYTGDTSVERLDQRIFHVLYWIGMLWGTLAVL
jgi:hypothetical protein